MDFVDAYKHFSDPEWDGEPISEVADEQPKEPKYPKSKVTGEDVSHDGDSERPKKIKIKLRDGKEREIQHMISTSFWSADGKPISAEEFLQNMFGALPEFFKDENDLRKIWSSPITRKIFLEKIAELGYDKEKLETLQKMIDAEDSDLFDVLSYVSFATKPISRKERVEESKSKIFNGLSDKQKEFLEFVLDKYIEKGVEELDEEKLPILLNLKYDAIIDAEKNLGSVKQIRFTFFDFQRELYRVSTKNN